MKSIIIAAALLAVGCAHNPNCGGGAPAIYQEAGNCIPRIRQVVIGSDLRVPDSLKSNFATLKLDWVESTLQDGRIVLGHFILVPGETR